MKGIFYSLMVVNLAFLAYFSIKESEFDKVRRSSFEEPSIQLLSKRKGRSARELKAEHILENPIVAAAEEGVLDCQSLGPFEDIVSAQDLTERLNGSGFQVELRAVDEATAEFDYRVLIPPAASVQEAYRRLRELKSQDIGSYVMSQGDDSLGISLGVFPSKEAAVVHRRELAEDGYETQIREIPRFVRGYWVFADRGVYFPSEEVERATVAQTIVELTETVCLN